MDLYEGIDARRIKVFGTQVQENKEYEGVLTDITTKTDKTIPNDYVFAFVGGTRPTKFLESLGITIG